MVGAKIEYKVADGEILEHIAGEANLREKTMAVEIKEVASKQKFSSELGIL